MGDIIQVLDTVTVETRKRITGDAKRDGFEICVMYPDYMDRDNTVVPYITDNAMRVGFARIIAFVMEHVV